MAASGQIERHDDRRISRSCSNVGACGAGKQQSIQLVSFHHFIDAVRRCEFDVFCTIAFVARPVGGHIHFVGDIQLRLTELDRAILLMFAIPLAQFREAL